MSLKVIDVIEEEYSCEYTLKTILKSSISIMDVEFMYSMKSQTPYEKRRFIPYSAPGDRHYFTVKTITRFTYIKFTSDYFETYHRSSKSFSQEITPTSIMQIQWLKEDKITVNEPCQTILKNIFENIILYNSTINVLRSSIVYYHILSILE